MIKKTFHRPFIHHIIVIGYVVAPIINILLVSLFVDILISQTIGRLSRGYGTLMTVWLLTAPIVGVGLYLLHRASWYLFLAHSGLLLVDCVAKWVAPGAYYWETVPSLHLLILTTGNLALVAAVAFIMQRDFRAPYFHVLQRTFRRQCRVPMRHWIEVDGEVRRIGDLSTGGCFAATQIDGMADGAACRVRTTIKGERPAVAGRIAWICAEPAFGKPPGTGIRFNRRQRRLVRRAIDELELGTVVR